MQDFLQSTVGLVIGLIVYIVLAFPLYAMGQKTNQEYPWFAFVPILNIVLMVQIAKKELWWIILFFIPCLNIIALVVVWMAIAEEMGKPSWLGILMLIPGVNLIIPYYLAFG
jgi:hypothetical protein